MITKVQANNLREKYGTEQVFVVPYLDVANVPDHFSSAERDNLDWIKKGKYIFRYDAEYNTFFQQVIPYVVLTDKKKEKFYISKRISGEERLVNQLSIGFGGHINPCDGYYDPLEKCIARELNEEVSARYIKEPLSLLGTVRDMSSSTNDHIGVVFLKRVSNKATIKIREKDKLKGQWMTMNDLYDNYGSFESWGKYIIDYLYQKQQRGIEL